MSRRHRAPRVLTGTAHGLQGPELRMAGGRPLPVPAAVLPPCRCEAFQTDLREGRVTPFVMTFTPQGGRTTRHQLYRAVTPGQALEDSAFLETCPHCGDEVGSGERLTRMLSGRPRPGRDGH